jgi:hypothetical protein
MLRLATPADRDVRWRLQTKVITSWTTVGGDHELRAWTHDQQMFCKRPLDSYHDSKMLHFSTEIIFTEKVFSHRDIWIDNKSYFLKLTQSTFKECSLHRAYISVLGLYSLFLSQKSKSKEKFPILD